MGGSSANKSAVKVWEKREYKNLDDKVSLNTRNIQIALKRLRKFARKSSELEFDLEKTISSTSKNAGLLDIKYRPERTNKVRVLLFIDIGGSMDEHAKICEEIFEFNEGFSYKLIKGLLQKKLFCTNFYFISNKP